MGLNELASAEADRPPKLLENIEAALRRAETRWHARQRELKARYMQLLVLSNDSPDVAAERLPGLMDELGLTPRQVRQDAAEITRTIVALRAVAGARALNLEVQEALRRCHGSLPVKRNLFERQALLRNARLDLRQLREHGSAAVEAVEAVHPEWPAAIRAEDEREAAERAEAARIVHEREAIENKKMHERLGTMYEATARPCGGMKGGEATGWTRTTG